MSVKIIYKLLLVFLVLLSSCEEEIDWDIKSDNTIRLVVDGILTNENIQQCIKLSVTNRELNMSLSPVSGAVVFVYTEEEIYEFIEYSEQPGSYFSAPFQAVVNEQYFLYVEYDEYVSEAVADAIPVTPMEEAHISKNEENGLFRYVNEENDNASMLELNYNWEMIPDYCTYYGNCFASETFYTLDNIDVSQIYAPNKQIIWFPSGTSIVRKKYSLTENHQRFLRSLLMETEWRGGIFDVEHGNIPTNLSNGALGYFAVCMIVSDTIYVN